MFCYVYVIITYIGKGRILFTEDVLIEVISMIKNNLFRPLPPADAELDEEDEPLSPPGNESALCYSLSLSLSLSLYDTHVCMYDLMLMCMLMYSVGLSTICL